MQTGTLMQAGDTLFYDNTNTFSGYEDSAGNTHRFITDLKGRVIEVNNPTTGTTTIMYDDADNIIARTDARGVTVRYAYDGMNRIAERWDDANREASLVTWHYDTAVEGCELTECTNSPGQLVAQSYSVNLGNGSRPALDRFGYDVRRRKVFAGRRLGARADLPVEYTFDNQDRVTSITHPDGTRVEKSYDAAGRLIGVPGFISDITYDERNLLASATFANGASVTRHWDDLMRVEGQESLDGAGTAIHDITFTLDRVGHIEALSDTAQNERGVPSITRHYTLDDWYRAASTAFTAETLTFDLDTLDRVTGVESTDTSSIAHRGAITYEDARQHLVADAGGMDYEHNAAGHMSERGDHTFTRDELGRISAIAVGGATHGMARLHRR